MGPAWLIFLAELAPPPSSSFSSNAILLCCHLDANELAFVPAWLRNGSLS